MRKQWRAWVLAALFAGPILIYVVLGALWLAQHRGPLGLRGELLYYVSTAWVLSGILFAYLASRWTKSSRHLLPPLDWDAPQTFTPNDRQAWEIVQGEAERADERPLADLTSLDTYIDTGRDLARRLALHYQPLARDPIEHVPLVEMLTAFQLASEDLATLSRDVPGGDMVTLAHFQKAVQAAGYLQKANDLYTLLLPIFQPAAGLVRLGTQKWMVQPAWKNMQQNLMRWFFRAYLNRLGVHLIELYSGRLAIGADQYRRLSRAPGARPESDGTGHRMVIAVAGAKGSGKSVLIEALESARGGDLAPVRARLRAAGFDPALADRLAAAEVVEAPGYTGSPAGETARDRQRRREALEAARAGDLLLVVLDARRDDRTADAKFVEAWQEWFALQPGRETPPALAVLSHVDDPALDPDPWAPPYDWAAGARGREVAVRARLQAARAAMPAAVADIIPVGAHARVPHGVAERLLPELAALLHRAERAGLLRHLHALSSRSKARRLLDQVGRTGGGLWHDFRARRRDAAPRA
jgi:predicted GTPase